MVNKSLLAVCGVSVGIVLVENTGLFTLLAWKRVLSMWDV